MTQSCSSSRCKLQICFEASKFRSFKASIQSFEASKPALERRRISAMMLKLGLLDPLAIDIRRCNV